MAVVGLAPTLKSGRAGASTVRLRAFGAELKPFAEATIEKLLVPTVVGVPEISPFIGDRDKPAGKDPEITFHAYGGAPSTALNVTLYGFACKPLGSDTVVTVGY